MLDLISIDFIDLAALYIVGLSAVFQPCIYPMVPVFLTYVIGASKNKAWKGVSMLLFTLGLYASFAIYGLVATISADFVSKYLTFTIDVATLFTSLLIFGFGLLMFTPLREIFTQIRLPKLKPKGGGLLNAFFVGFIMAIIAAPCAGGSILVALTIVLKQSSYTINILATLLGMGIFSLGLASPLIALGFFASKIGKIHGRISRSFLVKYGEELLGIILIAFSFMSILSLGLPALTAEFLSKALSITVLFSSIIIFHVSIIAFKAYRIIDDKIYALLSVGFIFIGLFNLFSLFEKLAIDVFLPSTIFYTIKMLGYSLIALAFTYYIIENWSTSFASTLFWHGTLETILSIVVIVELLIIKLKAKRDILPLIAYFTLSTLAPLLHEFSNFTIFGDIHLDSIIWAFSGFTLLPLLHKSRNAIRNMEVLLS